MPLRAANISRQPGALPSCRFRMMQFAIRPLIDRLCATHRTSPGNDRVDLSFSMEPEILGVSSKWQNEQNDELLNVHSEKRGDGSLFHERNLCATGRFGRSITQIDSSITFMLSLHLVGL
jgi:hypothetical protein